MMAVPLSAFLIVSALVFTIGVFGLFYNRHSLLMLLVSLELMLLAVNINFVAFAGHWQDVWGQIYTLLILTAAAAEIAIGLAILVVLFRQRREVSVESISELRG